MSGKKGTILAKISDDDSKDINAVVGDKIIIDRSSLEHNMKKHRQCRHRAKVLIKTFFFSDSGTKKMAIRISL